MLTEVAMLSDKQCEYLTKKLFYGKTTEVKFSRVKTVNTACSFGKIDVLGGKWLTFVFRVYLKVVNKALSMYS